MRTPRTPRQAAVRSVFAYVSITLLFALVCLTWGRSKLLGDGYFWDSRVYATAIAIWRAGGNPYLLNPTALPFVNPPLFLKSAACLSHLFPGHLGWYLYLAILCIAVGALPWILAKFYIRSQWMSPVIAVALFSLQPRFFAEQTLTTGNIADLLYPLALFAGVPGLRRNNWTLFYIVVIVAALIKPTFLTLLILPLLAGTQQIRRTTFSVVIVAALYLVQRLTMPALYAAFQNSLYFQLIVRHDVGSGLYGYFLKLGSRIPLLHGPLRASIAHFAITGLLMVGLFLLQKSRYRPAAANLWIPALLVAAIFINPRLQGYDLAVAILPAIYICVECIRQAANSSSGMAVAAIGITAFVVVFTTDAQAGMCLLLSTSLFLVLLRLSGGVSGKASFPAFSSAAEDIDSGRS